MTAEQALHDIRRQLGGDFDIEWAPGCGYSVHVVRFAGRYEDRTIRVDGIPHVIERLPVSERVQVAQADTLQELAGMDLRALRGDR
jgi:hypothetical protein